MSNPPPRGGQGKASLKFQPKKVARRSSAERLAAAAHLEQERQEEALLASSSSIFQPFANRGRVRGRGSFTHTSSSSTGVGRGQGQDAGGFLSGPSPAGPPSGRERRSGRQQDGKPVAGPSPAAAAGTSTEATATTAAAVQETAEAVPSSSSRGARASRAGARGSGETRGASSRGGASSSRGGRPRKSDIAKDEEKKFNVSDSDDATTSDPRKKVIPREYDRLLDLNSDDNTDSQSSDDSGPPLRPLPIPRYDHVDRTTSVNTDATSAESARLRERDAQERAGANPSHERANTRDGRSKKSTMASVKTEDGIVDEMDGVEGVRVGMGDIDVLEMDENGDDTPMRLPTQQIREELDEEERLASDRKTLLQELGPVVPTVQPGEGVGVSMLDEEEDEDMRTVSESSCSRDGKVFLFQLPPVMPDLVPEEPPPVAKAPTKSPGRKQSTRRGKQKATMRDEAEQEEAPQMSGGRNTTIDKPIDVEPPFIDATNAPTHSGKIGTLTVYADGEARIFWGGIEYEMKRGVIGALLQEVVSVERDEASDVAGASGGFAGSGDAAGKITAGAEEGSDAKGKRKTRRKPEKGKPKGRGTSKNAGMDTNDDMDIDEDANADGDMEGGPEPHTNLDDESKPPRKAVALGPPTSLYVVTPAWGPLLDRAI